MPQRNSRRPDFDAIVATAHVLVERGITGRGGIEERLSKWEDSDAVWAVIHEVQRITDAARPRATGRERRATEQVIREAIFAAKASVKNPRTPIAISATDADELARRIYDALRNGGCLAD